MEMRWRIELFGGLSVEQEGTVALPGGRPTITRFHTRKTGALLAYLAYYRRDTHSRESLIELLWPECELRAARNNLSVSLSWLRHRLEPPGVAPGAVLVSDRTAVRLNPSAVTTDVAAFHAALQAASGSKSSPRRAEGLAQAIELYRGELLAGYYDDWVLRERERLSELYFQALHQLIALLEAPGTGPGPQRGPPTHEAVRGDLHRALEYARRGVSADPLREEAHRDLMRLLAAAGQPAVALRQYRELERLLQRELGARPDADTRALARRIDEGMKLPGPGAERLPDGTTPERGFQVEEADRFRRELPSSRAEPLHPGHLPLPFTRFFGREEEIARLGKLLLAPETRLVTLTGPAGSGKTRLALEVAGRLLDAWRGVVWFVSLAELSEPRRIISAVRDLLRLPRSRALEPLEQVVADLCRQPTLLLLDNFEHLVTAGAARVRTLLERVPTLTCLVTSRQRLDLTGEHEFPVLPLPIPNDADTPVGANLVFALSQCESVQLFVDRAQMVRPDFRVTQRNASAVAGLCQRLEGIPLALELAAARAQVLTPARMLAHLEHRFDFLVSRQRDTALRHRTLRAALEWSYRLLAPELQRFFAQLCVFRGGWTLEAAAAVCETGTPQCGAGPAARPALDYLEALRNCSLVLAEEPSASKLAAPGGEMRFRMLETLREYGREQLTPDELAALEGRHAAYCLALAEQAEPELKGPRQGEWLARLEQEHDNLRAALAWSLADPGASETGLRLAGALWRFWWMHGHLGEGREHLARALSRVEVGEPTAAWAKALRGAGALAGYQGDLAASRSLLEESVVLFRRFKHRSGVAYSLNNLGITIAFQSDRVKARSLLEESVATFREVGDRWGIAVALTNLGDVVAAQGDYFLALSLQEESLATLRELGDNRGIAVVLLELGNVVRAQGDCIRAHALYEESLARMRELEDKWGIAASLSALGGIVLFQGDSARARSMYEESLAIRRELGDKRGIATSLFLLGGLAAQQGDHAAARSVHEESLAIQRQLSDRVGIAWSLQSLGNALYHQKEHGAARALYEESLAFFREMGDKRGIASSLYGLGSVADAQGDHEKAAALYRESLVLLHGLGYKGSIAGCLDELGRVAVTQGQPERAARLFGVAAALREAINTRWDPVQRADYEPHVAATRAGLGEEAFAAAWAEGQGMTLEQAVAYVTQEEAWPQLPCEDAT
jgi:predicted ATPase/DNA-binding SARP family transcriptional activator